MLDVKPDRPILHWALILWLCLDVYCFLGPIQCGELFVLFSIVLEGLKLKKIEFDGFIIFYFYVFIISFCFLAGSVEAVDYLYIKKILAYIFYGFILLALLEIGVDERFVKRFVNFGTFVCFLALIQWMLLSFGVKFVEILPFLTNTLGQSYIQLQANLQRVCGPFTEPAHLAQYLNILLILMIFSKKVYWPLIF